MERLEWHILIVLDLTSTNSCIYIYCLYNVCSVLFQPTLAAGTVALGAALIGIPAVLEAPKSGPTPATSPSTLGVKVMDSSKSANPKTLAEQEARAIAMKQKEQQEIRFREAQEQERIAAAERRREAAERFEQERIAAAKKAEAERLEQERIAAAEKKAEAERLEQERIAAERKAEAARIEAQRIEQERIAAERRAEEARIQAERERAEAARIEAQRIEQERIAAEKRAEAARIETERIERERAMEQQRFESGQNSDASVPPSPSSWFDLNAEKEAAERALAVFAQQKQQSGGNAISDAPFRPGDVKVDISEFAVPGVAVLSAAIGTLAAFAKKNTDDADITAGDFNSTANTTSTKMNGRGNVTSPFSSSSASFQPTVEEKKSPFGSGFSNRSMNAVVASPSSPPSPTDTKKPLISGPISSSSADIKQTSGKATSSANPFASTSNSFASATKSSPFDRQKPLGESKTQKDVAVKTGPFAQFGGVAKQAPKKEESQNASFGGKASDPTPSSAVPTTKVGPSLTSDRPSLIDEMDSVIATRGISDSMKKESADKAAKFDKLGSGSAGIQSFIEKDGDSSDGSRKAPIILPAAGSAGEASSGGIGNDKDVASAQQEPTTGGSAAGEKEKSREGPILLGAPKSKVSPGPSPALATNPFDRVGSKDALSPSGSSVPIVPKQGKESPAQKANPFDQFASSPRPPTVPEPATVGDNKSTWGIPAPNGSRKANPFDQFSSQSPAVDSNDTNKPKNANPFDQFAKPKSSGGGTSQPPFGAKANGDTKQTANPFDQFAKPKSSGGGPSMPSFGTKAKSDSKQAVNPFDQFAKPKSSGGGPSMPSFGAKAKSDSKQAAKPFDQFAKPKSSGGGTTTVTPPSFGAKAQSDAKQVANPFDRFGSGTPKPTKSNVPLGQPLQDSEKPQSIGSPEQKRKPSSSPFQNIAKALSPKDEGIIDEVKQVARQQEEAQSLKGDDGVPSFAENKREEARKAYVNAERLGQSKSNYEMQNGNMNGGPSTYVTPSQMQQQQEKYPAGSAAGRQLSDFSQMYSSSSRKASPPQPQQVVPAQQVQTAPRTNSPPTPSLAASRPTQQQYPAGSAAGVRLTDFSQMYQKRNNGAPKQVSTTAMASAVRSERVDSNRMPVTTGSRQSARLQVPSDTVANGWERVEIQWKVGGRHFASTDRKRLNSPKELALGENGFSLQLHLDGQGVAVSLSLENMQTNMRMRNLRVYVYCYDGPDQVVAHAADLERSAGDREVELLVPSNGLRTISTGLSSFTFTNREGQMAEATRQMLYDQARRDVLRVYATFDVAPL